MRSMDRMRKIEIFRLHPDLSPAELRLLQVIARCPEGITVSALTKELDMPMPGVSRMMRSLESRGLIKRQMSPIDRRSIIVSITPSGLETYRSFDLRVHTFFTRLMESVDPDEFDRLIAIWNSAMDQMEVLLEKQLKEIEEEASQDREKPCEDVTAKSD